MSIFAFPFGLALGLFVANTLIYKFLHGQPWMFSLGVGATAGVIGFVLMTAYTYWSNR